MLLQGGSFLTLMSKVATFPPSGLHFPPLDEFPAFGLHFAFSAVFLLGPAWSQSPHRSGMQPGRRESLLPLLSCVSIFLCLSVFLLAFQLSCAFQYSPLIVSILPCFQLSCACQYSPLLFNSSLFVSIYPCFLILLLVSILPCFTILLLVSILPCFSMLMCLSVLSLAGQYSPLIVSIQLCLSAYYEYCRLLVGVFVIKYLIFGFVNLLTWQAGSQFTQWESIIFFWPDHTCCSRNSVWCFIDNLVGWWSFYKQYLKQTTLLSNGIL